MDAKPEIPSYFGFDDVHAFKDYLGMVLCCAPDLFIEEEWLPPDQQMNLERAFEGLRYGFDLVEWEFDGAKAAPMRQLAGEALVAYRKGDDRGGQAKLESAEKLLRRLRTQ